MIPYVAGLLLFGACMFAAGYFVGAYFEHERGKVERAALVERMRKAWKP